MKKGIEEKEMILERWKERFGLQNWQISLQYNPALKQIAKTTGDPRYQQAVIQFQGEEGISIPERIIIHELIHIIMSMYDFYVDNHMENEDVIQVTRENAVSQLSEIFIRNIVHD